MTQILQQKCKIKGGTRARRKHGALETCALLDFDINSELFLFLFFEFSVQKKCLAKRGGWAIAPSAPHPVP